VQQSINYLEVPNVTQLFTTVYKSLPWNWKKKKS